MQMMHKQWLFQNAHVHYRKLDGLAEEQHKEVFKKVEQLMKNDSADLLQQNTHLLEVNFEALGDATARTRLKVVLLCAKKSGCLKNTQLYRGRIMLSCHQNSK